jgi:hypothetical protein
MANRTSDVQGSTTNPSSAGVMSDGEATGGEMSDAGAKKKIKLKFGGGSPTGSRAGSPAPGRAGVSGSRAGSPAVQGSGKSSTFEHLSVLSAIIPFCARSQVLGNIGQRLGTAL